MLSYAHFRTSTASTVINNCFMYAYGRRGKFLLPTLNRLSCLGILKINLCTKIQYLHIRKLA